ncbi:MAG: hypothetical protein KDL10_01570, partial [Kiritimatiellae bacterium]|nr:hypothetical protein [Kiritimatiellia bacterium]
MSHDPEQPDLFAEKPRTPKKRSKKAAARPASPEPALEAPTVEDTDGVESGLPAHQIRGPFRDLVDTNFLDYAAYVIKDRAIPDIDDGLKPVQRRIL